MNRSLNSQDANAAVIFYIGQMGGGISEPESSTSVAQNDPSMHMSEKSTLTHASAEQTNKMSNPPGLVLFRHNSIPI
jgi:hypothetical protein